ncbi:carboxymuconolactone decarboxylase family protein [Streptomyces sp. c-19]|uniref:carboxymuconolactone decarboxylase family protein n=1 Tax=Streptomyces sp. c-19 TaxID=2789275 RepID=UPI00397F3169
MGARGPVRARPRPRHQFHLGFARQNGVSDEELKEALLHLAFHYGWPNGSTPTAPSFDSSPSRSQPIELASMHRSYRRGSTGRPSPRCRHEPPPAATRALRPWTLPEGRRDIDAELPTCLVSYRFVHEARWDSEVRGRSARARPDLFDARTRTGALVCASTPRHPHAETVRCLWT